MIDLENITKTQAVGDNLYVVVIPNQHKYWNFRLMIKGVIYQKMLGKCNKVSFEEAQKRANSIFIRIQEFLKESEMKRLKLFLRILPTK